MRVLRLVLAAGCGYAFAQANPRTLQEIMLTANGDRSRWCGSDPDTGDLNYGPPGNLDSDLFVRSLVSNGFLRRVGDQSGRVQANGVHFGLRLGRPRRSPRGPAIHGSVGTKRLARTQRGLDQIQKHLPAGFTLANKPPLTSSNGLRVDVGEARAAPAARSGRDAEHCQHCQHRSPPDACRCGASLGRVGRPGGRAALGGPVHHDRRRRAAAKVRKRGGLS